MDDDTERNNEAALFIFFHRKDAETLRELLNKCFAPLRLCGEHFISSCLLKISL